MKPESSGTDARPRTLILQPSTSLFSGTTKIALHLASGFRDAGHCVRLVFFDSKRGGELLETDHADIEIAYHSTPLSRSISRAIELPLIRLFESGSFLLSDSVDLVSQLLDREVRHWIRTSDYVIIMNQWASIPLVVFGGVRGSRVAVLIHEPPSFRELPSPVRSLLRAFVRKLVNSVDLVLSISPKLERTLRSEFGIDSSSMVHAVLLGTINEAKGDYVLTHTRWTEERDPAFIVGVAALAPGVRFLMVGNFPNAAVKEELVRKLRHAKVEDHVELIGEVSEERLEELYAKARCYIRWSALHGEMGVSTGLFQAIGVGCVPVVSEDIGSADEVKRAISPQLVVPRTAEGFAHAIEMLTQNNAAYRQLFDKVVRYRETHSWEQYAGTLSRMLDQTKE